MEASEHARIALSWLTVSDKEFAEGMPLQASEKLWGAAAHAMLAVALGRGWRHGSHRDFVVTVRRLVEESSVDTLSAGFDAAHQFHANFYQDFLDDDEIAENRPLVHQFVPIVLTFLDITADDETT